MDWSSVIGRRRPLEHDALRLLTVVHQLGEPSASSRLPAIDTEGRLRGLDHLVREPVDLAFLWIDLVRERDDLRTRRAGLARRVRSLLGQDGARADRRRPFVLGAWERWDDALAFLACRGLLRIEPLADRRGEVRYALTGAGGDLLDGTGGPGIPGPYLERFRLLREALPLLDDELERSVAAASRRLEAFRREEQLPVEDALLRRLFRAAFGEHL